MKDAPLWKAIPTVAVVLCIVAAGFWQADVRGDNTLYWATVLLCVALLPPIIDGWCSGRGKPRPFRLDGDR